MVPETARRFFGWTNRACEQTEERFGCVGRKRYRSRCLAISVGEPLGVRFRQGAARLVGLETSSKVLE